jgi:hypothetical protein
MFWRGAWALGTMGHFTALALVDIDRLLFLLTVSRLAVEARALSLLLATLLYF